jgi:uncharacterized protein (DUF1810 family)
MAGLTRFHEAQENVWPVALAELRAGRKATHWIWFIFPQLTALGRSATALHYGIANLAEARAYLADPVLGARLDACAEAVLLHAGERPEAIMGTVDALKLRSSATLFTLAGKGTATGTRMQAILEHFYGGQPCPLTLAHLEQDGRS